jgi:hypothetical protein
MKKALYASALALVATAAIAAASQGLKWSASVTYDDGTPIETTKKVVYLIFDASNGKQVYSTPNLIAAASNLPADGCFYMHAAILNDAGTGVVEGSQSAPTTQKCTKPATPVQKRVSMPANFNVQ